MTHETQEDRKTRVLKVFHDILQRDNSLSRCQAVMALGKLNCHDQESGRLLTQMLLDQEPDVRMDAALVIGNLGIEASVEQLLHNLEADPEGDVRILAVEALAKIADKKSVARLINCLREDGYPNLDYDFDDMEFSHSWEVHSKTLEALGTIGDQSATDAVIELLENEDYEDLLEVGCRVLAQLSGTVAQQFLRKKFDTGRSEERQWALSALADLLANELLDGDLHSTDVVVLIGKAMCDADSAVRCAAVASVKKVQDPVLLDAVVMALDDDNVEVKYKAIEVLGSVGGSTYQAVLCRLLGDSDNDIQRSVMQVIAENTQASMLSVVIDHVDSQDIKLRYLALQAVAHVDFDDYLAAAIDEEEAIASVDKFDFLQSLEARIIDAYQARRSDTDSRIYALKALGSVFVAKEKLANLIAEDASNIEEDIEENVEENATEETDDQNVEEVDTLQIIDHAIGSEDSRLSFCGFSTLKRLDLAQAVKFLIKDLFADVEKNGAETTDINKISVVDVSGDGANPTPSNVVELADLVEAGSDSNNSTLASILMQRTGGNPVGESVEAGIEESVGKDDQAVNENASESNDSEINATELEAEIKESHWREIQAARLLADIPGQDQEWEEPIVDALLSAAQSGDDELYCEVLRSLGQIANQRALPLFSEAIVLDKGRVRTEALKALVLMDELPQKSELFDQLLNDPSQQVRELLVKALLGKEGHDAERCLEIALDDEDAHVCRAALQGVSSKLYRADWKEKIYAQIFSWSGDLLVDAVTALKRVDEYSVTDSLLARLENKEDEEYHWLCINALAEFCS